MTKVKFKLGDRVTYESKNPAFSFDGTVIAATSSWGRRILFVHPDTPQVSKGYVHFRKYDTNKYSEILPEYFDPRLGSTHWLRSKDNIALIASASKCLRQAELPYDPSQQGDKDDDI